MTRVRAAVLDPTSPAQATFLPDAVVAWDARGTIRAVEPFDGQAVDEDLRPGLIVPGFVDAHVHYPQTRIVGRATGPLLDWLASTTFPEEARFASASHAEQVAAVFTRALLRSGTTGALVYGSVHRESAFALMTALDRSGLRAIAGPVWMDDASPAALTTPPERSEALVEELVARWHGHDGGRLGVAVIPRFALSCTRDAMRRAARLADRHGLVVSTHVSESLAEVATVHERFGRPYIDLLDDLGLLGPRTLLAHAIHVDDADARSLASTGTAVAHCPDSNAFLGSGTMPVGRLRDAGVDLLLGSDVAAGRSFRLAQAASYAYDNALRDGVTTLPATWFYALTVAPAQRFGWNTGRVAPGHEADLVLRALPPWVDDAPTALAALLFDADAPAAVRTWVRGTERWRDDGQPWWHPGVVHRTPTR